MFFLTDENVATSVVFALRSSGHDVVDIKEQGWYGATDLFLINKAVQQKRIIITHDKDFLQQKKVTVILLRFYNQNPSNTRTRLLEYLADKSSKKIVQKISLVILSEYSFEIHHF